jgi:hypothetical protein
MMQAVHRLLQESMHFANLSKGHGFKFQKTRHTKDRILNLIFDLESEKELRLKYHARYNNED